MTPWGLLWLGWFPWRFACERDVCEQFHWGLFWEEITITVVKEDRFGRRKMLDSTAGVAPQNGPKLSQEVGCGLPGGERET